MWNIFDSLTKTKAKKLMYTSLLSFLSWKSFYNIGIQVMEFLRSWIYEYIYIYIYIYYIYIYIYIYHIYIYTNPLLQWSSYISERRILMRNLNTINPQILKTISQLLTNTLLLGNSTYSDKTNIHILNATIDYIRFTKRFD